MASWRLRMPARNILLIVSLVLSILIGVVIASGHGGGGGGDDERDAGSDHHVVIGLSLDTLKEERWQRDQDRFVERCKQLGAEVLVQAANSDDTVQMQNIESLLTKHLDCLVIVPHDGQAMSAAVKKAKELGVPVIAYDRMIKDCDLDLYCSFDNVEVGRQQARYLVDRLKGKGAIVRIYGAPTDNNAKLFKAGQDEVLAPYLGPNGPIKVVLEDWAEDWKPENAKKIAQAALAKGQHFDAILASNDGTASGAIQALSEEKLRGVVVTGQDAELAACQRIAAGTQTMTIYKPLAKLATGTAEMAVALAKRQVVVARDTVDNGEKAVPSVLFQVVTVTRENLLDVVKDGFHSYDDIYKGLDPALLPPRPQP
jgi:D-xylose transport system substrate-binding protein